jgi:tRNA A37 threonylcarbamoyladenosine dehydratase
MAERIVAINPACVVERVESFAAADNVTALVTNVDWVVDCVDQVSAKAALVAQCRASGVPVVVCGAGGGRVDPTRLRSADLARAHGDPLLAKLRYRLRRQHGFPRENGRRVPRFGVLAVYSDEPVLAPARAQGENGPGSPLACSGYGSSVAVTGAIGFAAAAAVMRAIVADPPPVMVVLTDARD